MSTKVDDFIKSQVDFYFEAVGHHIKDLSKEELLESLLKAKKNAEERVNLADRMDIINDFTDQYAKSVTFMIEALLLLEIILKRTQDFGIASRRRTTRGMH